MMRRLLSLAALFALANPIFAGVNVVRGNGITLTGADGVNYIGVSGITLTGAEGLLAVAMGVAAERSIATGAPVRVADVLKEAP